MQSSEPTFDPSEIIELRMLLQQPGAELETADFDEWIALESTRSNFRLWRADSGALAAFAFLDDFNNLCCSWDAASHTEELEAELVAWGMTCLRRRNAQSGEDAPLDACCGLENQPRRAFLEQQGFVQQAIRTLRYACSLTGQLPQPTLPSGFSLHSAAGEQQAEALAALHRAAFDSPHMTLEYRLAMMRAPQYDPSLDLYLAAPDGALAAFCVCSVAWEENTRDGGLSGYTDPVGVHPAYQGRGLGKAVLQAGLCALQARGMTTAKLGTSSDNTAMQRLAEAVGFRVVAEKLWYSKQPA